MKTLIWLNVGCAAVQTGMYLFDGNETHMYWALLNIAAAFLCGRENG